MMAPDSPGPDEAPEKKQRPRWVIYWAMITEMTMSITAGTVVGFYLDEYFNTGPILTIALLLAGCVAGLQLLIRLSRRLEEEENESP